MFNIEVRAAIKKARLFSYEVAAALGITESSVSRKMSRKEMDSEEKRQILAVIERLSKEER